MTIARTGISIAIPSQANKPVTWHVRAEPGSSLAAVTSTRDCNQTVSWEGSRTSLSLHWYRRLMPKLLNVGQHRKTHYTVVEERDRYKSLGNLRDRLKPKKLLVYQTLSKSQSTAIRLLSSPGASARTNVTTYPKSRLDGINYTAQSLISWSGMPVG